MARRDAGPFLYSLVKDIKLETFYMRSKWGGYVADGTSVAVFSRNLRA
jgi:hypothetical protein